MDYTDNINTANAGIDAGIDAGAGAASAATASGYGGSAFYYNASVVMRNAPDIMGLDLTQKKILRGYQWVGPYRLTGERCGHRKDKLKVYAWKGKVWVQEEGVPSISIQKWLVEYGGCADYRDAGRLLRMANPACRVQECVINMHARTVAGRYVDAAAWDEYDRHSLDWCPLYTWMCRLFGQISADAAFRNYMATTNERGEMVYWYVDISGKICHDKVMAYQIDGHRNKNRGGWRRFTSADGYTNRCYYGSNLLADRMPAERVMVVEGEKTAMVCSIVWPEYVWIATGGKNQLRDVEPGWTLLPDVDAADEWASRGKVSKWWEMYDGRGEHSDIGDYVEFCAGRRALDELRSGEMKEKLFNNL